MDNWNWLFLDSIQDEPAYLERVDKFSLQRLASMIKRGREDIQRTANKLKAANLDRGESITTANFPEWAKLDFWEGQLNAELERRGGVVVAPKSKPAPPPAEPLPAFDDAYKGSLSDLWGELSTMPKPLVSKSGNFIWTGESVSVLMALAQALLTADRITGKRSAESVYRMLCTHFGIEAAERQKAVTKKGTSTHAYLDHLATFNDLFQDLG